MSHIDLKLPLCECPKVMTFYNELLKQVMTFYHELLKQVMTFYNGATHFYNELFIISKIIDGFLHYWSQNI
jgi:hypothetical protein